MNERPVLVATSTEYLLDVRRRHDLPYRNNRAYDYAFGHLQVLPEVLRIWQESGIDLSMGFVDYLWLDHANKKPGNSDGEWHRAAKLTLDAFKAWYDVPAFSEFGGVDVARYVPSLDMRGVDLELTIGGTKVNVQTRMEVFQDFSGLKKVRQRERGDHIENVIDLVAKSADLDGEAQPYLPKPEWYRRVVDQIANRLPGMW